MSDAYAHLNYQREGLSNDCKNDGTGGPWSNEVYEVMTGNHY